MTATSGARVRSGAGPPARLPEPAATTTGAAVVRAADAEVLEFANGSSMRLLVEGVATMSVHHSVLAAGSQGASPHHHHTTAELIYVLAGSLLLLVDDRTVVAGAGDLVVIPPGVTHAFAATDDGNAELLDVVTPGIERFDMFRHLARGRRDHHNDYDTYADDSPTWS